MISGARPGPRLSEILTSFLGAGGEGGGLEFREYFASACPHCVRLAPEWKAAAEQYHGPVRFRSIECADEQWQPVEANAKLCEGVHSFPTMKLYRDGKAIETYSGERNADALVNYAREHEGLAKDVAEAALPAPALVLAALAPSPAVRSPSAATCVGLPQRRRRGAAAAPLAASFL
eukprot:TRINITY_DN31441_c0_g1_i1.p2 TRINITY_DN31441_c0_g1~~TRINITY_DN31441_c0_g1_i1.p2  ORF type:complete len:195 (-),score=41.99 TRINITY_DN31441_c0_g1_i1:44-571(-)